jgi:hypothetical protein
LLVWIILRYLVTTHLVACEMAYLNAWMVVSVETQQLWLIDGWCA